MPEQSSRRHPQQSKFATPAIQARIAHVASNMSTHPVSAWRVQKQQDDAAAAAAAAAAVRPSVEELLKNRTGLAGGNDPRHHSLQLPEVLSDPTQATRMPANVPLGTHAARPDERFSPRHRYPAVITLATPTYPPPPLPPPPSNSLYFHTSPSPPRPQPLHHRLANDNWQSDSDASSHTANVTMRPYADAVDVAFSDSLNGTASIWSMVKRHFLKAFLPGELHIGALLTFSLDRRAVIASFVKLLFHAVSLFIFITLLRTMFDGYNDPQVNVAYEKEIDGFELPMVAMCGQMLNLGAFTASISGSEEEVDIQNSISVDDLISPQSSQGLPAFRPASRKLSSKAFAYADDGTACIQTKNVASTTNDVQANAEMILRDKQNIFYADSLRTVIAPFFPYLYFDNQSYINTPSCVV